MFPLRDDNPTQDASIVVYALIVINVLIFGYQVSLLDFQLTEWLGTWALFPKALIANPFKEAITLLSSQFLHANIPRAKILSLVFAGFFFTVIPVPSVVFLGVWILGQTVYAAMANPNLPEVAYLAHISGFGIGTITMFLLARRSH